MAWLGNLWRGVREYWLRHDPDALAARRALRAALVVAPLFAVAVLVLDSPEFALGASFGGFAMLVLADFIGPYRTRWLSYLGFTLVGCVLLTVGTLASEQVWVAVTMAVVLGFVVRFSAVFGGAIAAAAAPLLILFSLAVLTPGTLDDVPARVLGLAAAGVGSTVAAMVVFPTRHRRRVRALVVEACRDIARLLEGGGTDDDLIRLGGLVYRMRAAFARAPNRANGPREREQAFNSLVDEVARAHRFVVGTMPLTDPGSMSLRLELARVFQASADCIEQHAAGPDLHELEAARTRFRDDAQQAHCQRLCTGEDARRVVAEMQDLLPLRALEVLAVSIGANARRVAGLTVPQDLPVQPEGPDGGPGIRASTRRALEIVGVHLSLRSVWLRTSMQTSLAITLAVVAAHLTDLPHGFWIALGTISALRSNATDTGNVAIQAVIGTFVGVVIASGVVVVITPGSPQLWVLLVPTLVLAATAPAFGGVAAGQGAFALFVVVLFNLLEPTGWEVGVIRFEAVALGAFLSVVSAVLLWPRGAAKAFADTVACLYRASSADVAAIPQPGEVRPTRVAVTRERRVADVAFDDFLRSKRGAGLTGVLGTRLLAVAGTARMGSDLFAAHAPEQDAMAVPGAVAVLVQGRVAASSSLGAVADVAAAERPRYVLPPASVEEVAAVLERAAQAGMETTRPAVRAMWAAGWLRETVQAGERVRPLAGQLADLAAVPWWHWRAHPEPEEADDEPEDLPGHPPGLERTLAVPARSSAD